MFQELRIHRSDEERLARAAQADVDRALEVLGAEADAAEARISGSVQDLRRRLDALLDDLLPPAAPPGPGGRLLRWMGLSVRARAADTALATLFQGVPPGTRHIAMCFGEGVHAFNGRVSPEQNVREHVADALDDAYCMLLPHEVARRAALHRSFWATAREENRQRQLIARCLEQPDQEVRANHNGAGWD